METGHTKIICTLAVLLAQLFTQVKQTALFLSTQRPATYLLWPSSKRREAAGSSPMEKLGIVINDKEQGF